MSDAEQSVIGGILIDFKKAGPAFRKLMPDMFQNQSCAFAFDICLKLHKAGKRIDYVTVVSVAGEAYKDFLISCACIYEKLPALDGYGTYIELVREGWRKRTLEGQLTGLLFDAPAVSAGNTTAELKKIIRQQELIEQQIKDETAKDFSDSAVEFWESLFQPDTSIKSGWGLFDRITGGLQRKGLYTITARSGKGKTDFALNLAMRLATRYRVNYNSMEMPRTQLLQRVISKAAKIDSNVLRDKRLTDQEKEDIRRVIDMIEKQAQIIFDEQAILSVQDVENKIIHYNCDCIFIDHLGLMQLPNIKNKWDAIGENTHALKQMAMKHNIVIVMLVQQNRSADTMKNPNMSTLKGSSDIENDADAIFAISADTGGQMITGNASVDAKIDVIKNRHGGTGNMNFSWQPQYHSWIPKEAEF